MRISMYKTHRNRKNVVQRMEVEKVEARLAKLHKGMRCIIIESHCIRLAKRLGKY